MDISNRERVMAFIANDTPESQKALQLMATSQRNREYGRAKSRDPEERAACLRSWYQTCQKVVRYATGKKNFTDTSIPRMTDKRAVAFGSPETGEEALQQPSQATSVLSPVERERVRAAAEASSTPCDAVVVLGNGDRTVNIRRAEIAAEIALAKGAALITTGGRVSAHHKRTTSEGNEAIQHVKADKRYTALFQNPDRPPAREDKSEVTGENLKNTVKYLKDNRYQNIIVVSTEGAHSYAGHGAKGARILRHLYPEAEISFYTPESPNIDRNMGIQRATKQTAQVESYHAEQERLSTTELLQIFESGKKEEIDRIIAEYDYPSLKEIESQLKNVPQGTFEEDPQGVVKRMDGVDNQILLTFDICSFYSEKDAEQVVNFIDNVASKRPPVPVVLFVTGNALSNPKILEAIIEASKYPHISIQNHGFEHRPLGTALGSKTPWDKSHGTRPTQNIEDAYYELVKGAILTQSITGTKTKFYRSSTLYMDTRGVKMANLLGFQVLGESRTGGDYLNPGEEQTGEIVLRHAKKTSSIEFVDNMRTRIQRQEINPILNIDRNMA